MTKILKRPLSVLLAALMVISLFAAVPMTASAITPPTYSGGTGTETDPWLISTVNDWKTFATAVNDGETYEGKYFRQTANLDLSAENGLAPVGNLEKPFVGNYNGGNYTISGASINISSDSAVAGVFGVLTGGGTISDLKVTNVTITATTGDGGWDQAYAGGLVALAEDCTITGCSVSNSNITANGSNTFAGAIVGFAGAENSEKTTFSKCASENNTVNTMGYGGGFIGAVVNDTSSDDAISFTDCYSANSTTDAGTNKYASVGAFLGGSQGGNVTVENCFVYDCNATATGVASTKGLFTGDTTYGTVKATNTYYYNNNALDINADSAISKSADEMKSLASALGEAFSDGALYPVLSSQSSHEHSFTYSASGDTITATCKNDGCDLTDSKVTLRIADPANIYYDDNDSSHHFTLVGLDDFNRVTGKTISVDNIVYYKGDNISQDIKNNRVKLATYKAKLTVEGVTAEHSFKFTAKPVAHTHSFTYSANGSVITATCKGTGTCDLANKQATLTIQAPACTKYNDGNSVEASIAGTIPGVTTPTIRYQKGSITLSSAPSDAGTYSASITLGSATAKVNYTIEKADTSYTSLPTANTLTYTGEMQDLVSAGTTAGGQIAYTAILDPDREPDVYQGDMPYSFSIPQMDDAGTYYVWYKLEGGKNYNSIAADKLVVTIAQADIHPNVSLEGWTLGEPAKTPVVSGNSGNGAVTFKYKVKGADDSTYTEKVPTNAGDYTVKATISETENYNGGVATADFTISKKPAINYGDDNYIEQDDKVAVSASDEGKSKFGLDLDKYFNMQILGVQLKNSIATEGGEDGIRFVTAVNTNLLKGNKIEDYGYIVVKAKDGTSVDKIYENMDKLTYDKVGAGNIFSCKGTSNTISGEFGQYASNTDYKYVTLSITGTSGSTDTVAARFYVKTTDGEYHYADYENSAGIHSGIAFNIADVLGNLG